jgi:hypothetical protein
MFIEIIQIKRLQEDGTRTCHAKQWPTPPSLIFRQDPALTITQEIADLEDLPETELKLESSWDDIVLLDEEAEVEG